MERKEEKPVRQLMRTGEAVIQGVWCEGAFELFQALLAEYEEWINLTTDLGGEG